MIKKTLFPVPDLIGFRPKADDKAVVTFIQKKISAPGMEANTADVIRRALHAFADELRAKDGERKESA